MALPMDGTEAAGSGVVWRGLRLGWAFLLFLLLLLRDSLISIPPGPSSSNLARWLVIELSLFRLWYFLEQLWLSGKNKNSELNNLFLAEVPCSDSLFPFRCRCFFPLLVLFFSGPDAIRPSLAVWPSKGSNNTTATDHSKVVRLWECLTRSKIARTVLFIQLQYNYEYTYTCAKRIMCWSWIMEWETWACWSRAWANLPLWCGGHLGLDGTKAFRFRNRATVWSSYTVYVVCLPVRHYTNIQIKIHVRTYVRMADSKVLC